MRNVCLLVACAVVTGCSQTIGTYRPPQNLPSAEVGRIDRLPRTQVPFPPGEWIELAGEDNIQVSNAANSNAVPMKAQRRAYGRIEGGRLVTLYEYWTNTVGDRGFTVPASCIQGVVGSQKVFMSDLHGGATNAFDCVVVWAGKFAVPSRNATEYYSSLYQASQKYGGLAPNAVSAQINAGYSGNSITVTLSSFPERDGITGGSWEPGQEGPRERAYINDLVVWAQGFRPAVIRGTKGDL